MTNQINQKLSFCKSVFEATQDRLSEITDNITVPFPELIKEVNGKLSSSITLTEAVLADSEIYIRSYVRTHPDYKVSRGVKGGVMTFATWQKKAAGKAAMEAAKTKIKSKIDAKVAELQGTAPDAVDESDDEDASE